MLLISTAKGKIVAITTTVIGAYPKPDYLELPDWFDPALVDSTDTAAPTKKWGTALEAMGARMQQLVSISH